MWSFVSAAPKSGTPNEGYKQLAKLLSDRVTEAPAQLKLCVSSREDDAILYQFPRSQGLKLQDLTEGDIHKYVKDKLESNQNFLDMEKPEDGVDGLVSRITERARGVFCGLLWWSSYWTMPATPKTRSPTC